MKINLISVRVINRYYTKNHFITTIDLPSPDAQGKSRRNFLRKKKEICKQAQVLLENGNIRILVDVTVPPEAINLLGTGLGFVPNPKENEAELRLDARRIVNKLHRHNPLQDEASTGNVTEADLSQQRP